MTFLELHGEELDRLLGTSSRALFTLAKRKAAINRGQKWFAEKTRCFRKEASIALVDGTSTYALTAPAADFVRLDGTPELSITVGAKTTYWGGNDFRKTDVATLDRTKPGWRNDSGRPQHWYLERLNGTTRFCVYPTPDIAVGETWAARLPYIAQPADMVADADEPFTASLVALDDVIPFHDTLALYAAHLLEPLRKDRVAAEEWLQQALRRVAEFLAQDESITGESVHLARNYRARGDGDFNQRIRVAGWP